MLTWLGNFAEDLGKLQEPSNADNSGTNTGHSVCWSRSIPGNHLLNVSSLRPRSCFWGLCPQSRQNLLSLLSFLVCALSSFPSPMLNIRITPLPIGNTLFHTIGYFPWLVAFHPDEALSFAFETKSTH